MYAIINIEDMKAYVGATKNAKTRAMNHAHHISTKSHSVEAINSDADKDFKFIILQKMDKNTPSWLLHAVEKMYMVIIACDGFALYNTQPQCSIGSYKDMCADIGQSFIYHNRTSENFRKAFRDEYGAETWHFKAKKPENRIKEAMERDQQ